MKLKIRKYTKKMYLLSGPQLGESFNSGVRNHGFYKLISGMLYKISVEQEVEALLNDTNRKKKLFARCTVVFYVIAFYLEVKVFQTLSNPSISHTKMYLNIYLTKVCIPSLYIKIERHEELKQQVIMFNMVKCGKSNIQNILVFYVHSMGRQ